MTRLLKILGLALMLLGVALLVGLHWLGLTFVNLLLLAALALVLLGTMAFVWGVKSESRY